MHAQKMVQILLSPAAPSLIDSQIPQAPSSRERGVSYCGTQGRSYYPLIGLSLERAFAHILTGHAMRALRSTRIISASAHSVSMQERVKSFPSVSGKASGSAGCPRTERGKLTVFRLSLHQLISWPTKKGICSYVTNMGKRRPTKRAEVGAAAQGPKRAWQHG